jgi:hypothetical protein
MDKDSQAVSELLDRALAESGLPQAAFETALGTSASASPEYLVCTSKGLSLGSRKVQDFFVITVFWVLAQERRLREMPCIGGGTDDYRIR